MAANFPILPPTIFHDNARGRRTYDNAQNSATSQARAKFYAERAYNSLENPAAQHADLVNALTQQTALAKARGLDLSGLPALHSQMGPADAISYQRRLNGLMGFPAEYRHGQDPLPYPGQSSGSPILQSMKPSPDPGFSFGASAFPARSTSPLDSIAAPPTNLERTGAGYTTDVALPNGSTRNVAVTPSIADTVAARIPGFSSMAPDARSAALKSTYGGGPSVPSTPAASPFNFKGERTVQTPSAPSGGTEYDPRMDLSISPVSVSGAARAVAVAKPYQTPGASTIGTFGAPQTGNRSITDEHGTTSLGPMSSSQPIFTSMSPARPASMQRAPSATSTNPLSNIAMPPPPVADTRPPSPSPLGSLGAPTPNPTQYATAAGPRDPFAGLQGPTPSGLPVDSALTAQRNQAATQANNQSNIAAGGAVRRKQQSDELAASAVRQQASDLARSNALPSNSTDADRAMARLF